MLCVLDAAVHVHAAIPAGVPLNGGIGIHDFELVGALGNTELVARHNGNLRKQCARGLPAFGASTDVIIGTLGRDAHLDGIARAFAHERPPPPRSWASRASRRCPPPDELRSLPYLVPPSFVC